MPCRATCMFALSWEMSARARKNIEAARPACAGTYLRRESGGVLVIAAGTLINGHADFWRLQ